MTSIALTPDTARWTGDINATCERFERRLRGGVANRVGGLQKQVVPIVERRRARPADPGKVRTPLAAAIQQSIRPSTGDIGIVVGDRNVLDSLAPHWHAIEVGSSHIVGMQFWGYVGPQGTFLPSGRRFRKESRRGTLAEVRAAGLRANAPVTVKRPIKPHRYLQTLGVAATRAIREETDMRVKESFGGIPYKRQGA